jgi:DNA-binding LacI/PurR family transcriptional regulator
MGRLGQEAAQLLLRRIEGDRSDFPEVRRLKTDLIIHDPVRGSME